jgi:hypothetical protein
LYLFAQASVRGSPRWCASVGPLIHWMIKSSDDPGKNGKKIFEKNQQSAISNHRIAALCQPGLGLAFDLD